MGFQGIDKSISLSRLIRRRKEDHRADSSAKQNTSEDTNQNTATASESEGRALDARRDLLSQISEFLLRHGLDVTPENLVTAHAALSGSDVELSQKIGTRQSRGQPITQQWLDQLDRKRNSKTDEHKQVDRLMTKLEHSIASFAATTENARSATANYRGEFSEHLSRVGETSEAGLETDFMAISRAMLDTLQRIETSMKHSKAETDELQERLCEARAEADSDHLTGLPNRRAFEREFYSAHLKALDQGNPLFLAIADIDHFKRVNDTFGHETGDRLLKAVADILRRFASENCVVARHGGEEFVLLIQAKDIASAQEQLDRARREVESRKFIARQQNKAIGQITFSAGLADVLASENPRDALAAADDALYASKEAGRNRITIADLATKAA